MKKVEKEKKAKKSASWLESSHDESLLKDHTESVDRVLHGIARPRTCRS